MINSIEPSPFDPAVCYVAGTLYKTGDFQPYLYKTADYGKTWTKITNGNDNQKHFTRVLRADPAKGRGCFTLEQKQACMSLMMTGSSWSPFQMNLAYRTHNRLSY